MVLFSLEVLSPDIASIGTEYSCKISNWCKLFAFLGGFGGEAAIADSGMGGNDCCGCCCGTAGREEDERGTGGVDLRRELTKDISFKCFSLFFSVS